VQFSEYLTYLPVFGITLQHHRILGLGDLIVLVLVNLLDGLLRLDAVILGESAVVALLYR
jgi:hypothetical protein